MDFTFDLSRAQLLCGDFYNDLRQPLEKLEGQKIQQIVVNLSSVRHTSWFNRETRAARSAVPA